MSSRCIGIAGFRRPLEIVSRAPCLSFRCHVLKRCRQNLTRALHSVENGHDGEDIPEIEGTVSDSQVSNLRNKKGLRGVPMSLPTFNSDTNTANALTRSLSEVATSEGRLPGGNKLVLGGDDSEEAWRALDEKINEYPDYRVFKGIGEGGQSFVESMVSAVESVVGPVAADNVRENKSSGGRYISVSVGPVCVTSGDQVRNIYQAMRKDKRVKWLI